MQEDCGRRCLGLQVRCTLFYMCNLHSLTQVYRYAAHCFTCVIYTLSHKSTGTLHIFTCVIYTLKFTGMLHTVLRV